MNTEPMAEPMAEPTAEPTAEPPVKRHTIRPGWPHHWSHFWYKKYHTVKSRWLNAYYVIEWYECPLCHRCHHFTGEYHGYDR